MLIGLAGEAGSGKDAAGRFVIEFAERLRIPVRRDAFADRLKVSAARALGMTNETWAGCIDAMNLLKVCGSVTTTIEHGPYDIQEVRISGREYLQYYGTEAHRDVFDHGFWVDAVLENYEVDEILVVTDCRFPNEAEAVRDRGGVVWRLDRPDLKKIASASHVSETPLPDHLVNEVIVNDGTLPDLRKLVEGLFETQLRSYRKVAA